MSLTTHAKKRYTRHMKSVNDQAFKEAYEGLNTEQRQAVDAIEGPVFVVAGPGTGKTQVLTLRIANILRTTDTPPDAILALTFTESAASEMRERLARIIGSAAWRVRIHTFHGFAESLIARFPDQFPRIIGAEIATDAERAEFLDAALLESEVSHLRPFGDPLYYHPHVARAIATMKREKVTPDELEERIAHAQADFDALPDKVHEKGKYVGKMKGEFQKIEKKIEKTRDLLTVYRAYEAALVTARRYDFDDLILEVVHALESDESFRLMVQESILYVLADEHQDANRAQNALLEAISGFFEQPNLFIVGDEKQAIYRFQGADLDNVHYFRSRFKDTTIISLVDNYRSTQPILDAALSLITSSPDTRLSRVPLQANAPHTPRPISLTTSSTPEGEIAQLAASIQDLIKDGAAPSDIAVLVRRNQDVLSVQEALVRYGVPATGGGEGNALHNRFVESIVRLLRYVAAPHDELVTGILTLPGFKLPPADVWRVLNRARTEKIPVLTVLGSETDLTAAGVRNVEEAKKLAAVLTTLSTLASHERPAVVAEAALRASGLLPRILTASDRTASLAAVRGLLHTFEELSRREHGALLPRALELIDLYEARNLSLTGRGGGDRTRVQVMTVHKAKGREFEFVFIPRLTSSAWSTRSRAEHFYLPDILSGSAELEDERRLLYVAITRARKHATLSYATSRGEGRTEEPSELIEDIDPALVQVEPGVEEVADPLTRDLNVTSGDAPSEDDLATLRSAFFAQGLSPTALNNFMECPWKYFYVNLLRIPEAENKFMLFGTAVHAALKQYADARNGGKEIGADGLIASFTRALARSPLGPREQEELQQKGERALSGWWEARHESWPTHTLAEQRVEAYLELTDDSQLLLRGALDRMDEMPGGVSVVDYKTGKPKSRNELIGNTKTADGNYYRQLTFYKLLLAKTESPQAMQEGVIEFVEPDESGTIRTESFVIPEEDVQALEETILNTAASILTLSFWNEPCDEVECPWCKLRFVLPI